METSTTHAFTCEYHDGVGKVVVLCYSGRGGCAGGVNYTVGGRGRDVMKEREGEKEGGQGEGNMMSRRGIVCFGVMTCDQSMAQRRMLWDG